MLIDEKEWKLVPVEPTDEMLYAGRDAIEDGGSTREVFLDMLDAAPQAGEDARDAARYRALRAGINNGDEWIRIVGSLRGAGSLSLTGDHADQFIDRALTTQGASHE